MISLQGRGSLHQAVQLCGLMKEKIRIGTNERLGGIKTPTHRSDRDPRFFSGFHITYFVTNIDDFISLDGEGSTYGT